MHILLTGLLKTRECVPVLNMERVFSQRKWSEVIYPPNPIHLVIYPPNQTCVFFLQEDFEFDGQAQFQEGRSPSESTTPMEGENMGGWWPEQSGPDTGVRARTVSISMHLPSTRHPHLAAWLWCVCHVSCWICGDPSHVHTFSYRFIILHQFMV